MNGGRRAVACLAMLLAATCIATAQPPLPPMEPLGHALLPDAFVRHWLVAGPLPGTLGSGGLANEGMLEPLPGDLAAGPDGNVPFHRYACPQGDPAIRFGSSSDGSVAYAVSYILTDLEWTGLRLLCGAGGGLRVWLNGKEVARSEGPTGQDQLVAENITLQKGVNRLVLKALGSERLLGGGFWTTARFADSAGNPMPDLFCFQRPDPARPYRPEGPGGAPSFGVDERGLIYNWLVLAPFPSGGNLGTQILPDEANVRPRPGETHESNGQTRTWTPHQAPLWIMDFVHYVGEPCDYALGYAVAYIAAHDTMENLTMRLSADDVSRVYLNGREVIVTQSGWFQPDKDQAGGITLNRGLNVLTAKTLNNDHLWQTAVRFVDAAGQAVTDLAILYAPDEPVVREPRVWPRGG